MPIRIVAVSPDLPVLQMSMLWEPMVRLRSGPLPSATFEVPVGVGRQRVCAHRGVEATGAVRQRADPVSTLDEEANSVRPVGDVVVAGGVVQHDRDGQPAAAGGQRQTTGFFILADSWDPVASRCAPRQTRQQSHEG